MPKAVLSNRIYLEVTPELKKSISDELTYVIPGYRPDEPAVTIRNMKLFKDNIVSIPSGREDLIPEGYTVVDKRVFEEIEFPDFEGTLRPSQQEIWDDIESSAIINAWVSFGKTFTALAIAGKLGQKTLVIAHTVPLRNQWVREIEKVYGFTPDIIGSGKFGTNTPIVVGNVQSLYNRVESISNRFGTIILDEMHHIGAPTFARLIDKCSSTYKLGLSGTLRRKDGKHILFKDYFGTKLYQPPKENYMTPEVHIYNLPFKLPDGMSMPWAKKINKILYDPAYQANIAMIAAAYAAKGHKVLLVGDRVEFLDNCAELIGPSAISITGSITDHDERELLISSITEDNISTICGTQSIFSEGVSQNVLSTLVMGTPIGNNDSLHDQLMGRVIREHPGKLTPIIVDVNLQGNTAKRQAQMRLGNYIRKGWKVKVMQ